MRILIPIIFSCFIQLFISILLTIQAQVREIKLLNSDWKFAKGPNENAFQSTFDDAQWQPVSIPHDWAISGPFIPDGDGNTGKLPWKGEGWYRHTFEIPQSYDDKQIYLLFDGVMAFPKVYINGIMAGKWDYGYNSFYINITEYLHYGKNNVLAVHADTRQHDSRWYPGAGIYRKVQMIVVNPVHIDIWGTHITTPIVKSHYTNVNITTTIVNSSAAQTNQVSLEHFILSPSGNEVSRNQSNVTIGAKENSKFESTITLTNPQRWDIDNPVRYKLKTIVRENNRIIDSTITSFGIRTMRFTPDDGFYLNDRRVQLKGVNLHHDHGPLGAAFYTRAMERQLQIMQSMGCNAVRTSHNTAAPELLDLCDSIGILVFNEIFDKYDRKADILDTTDFEEFAERNIRNFVMRDRNHPSVFLWSVGNEIGDVQWNINGGFDKLRTLIHLVDKYDGTRATTLVCDSRNSAKLRHFDFYDVHTWNYGRRYDLARQLEPNKAVIISESASTVSTRGFYEWPLPALKTDFTKSLQVSSYDLNAPDWAEISDDDFMWQQEENYIAGEFVWTGFDYLGEPTPYNNESVKKLGLTDKEASVSSYFGIVDLVGIPKDRYYLYKSYWNTSDTTIHILPHWNWPDRVGKAVPVFIYTNGDCAELFLNGRSLGTKCKKPDSPNSTERFRLMWNDVLYEPGTLKAVAYKEGELIGEKIKKTSGEPYALKLTPDRNSIKADGNDLSYILIESVDKNGEFCPLANNRVNIRIGGGISIAGVGNGNPQSIASFQSDNVNLFYGKAMLIVRSGHTSGHAEIKATSKGLIDDITGIKVE